MKTTRAGTKPHRFLTGGQALGLVALLGGMVFTAFVLIGWVEMNSLAGAVGALCAFGVSLALGGLVICGLGEWLDSITPDPFSGTLESAAALPRATHSHSPDASSRPPRFLS